MRRTKMQGMRVGVALVAVAAVSGVGVVDASPSSSLRVWAERAGSNTVEQVLIKNGIRDAADRSALRAGWDEDVLVDIALRRRAFGLILMGLRKGGFSFENTERIKAVIRAEVAPSSPIATQLVQHLPVEERQEFKSFLESGIDSQGLACPVFEKLNLKYNVLQDVDPCSPQAATEDLVRLLLAPEMLSSKMATMCKEAIIGGTFLAACGSGLVIVVRELIVRGAP